MRLRGAQALVDIANENVKTEQGLVDLTQALQEKGLTTGLDVENARAQLTTPELTTLRRFAARFTGNNRLAS